MYYLVNYKPSPSYCKHYHSTAAHSGQAGAFYDGVRDDHIYVHEASILLKLLPGSDSSDHEYVCHSAIYMMSFNAHHKKKEELLL